MRKTTVLIAALALFAASSIAASAFSKPSGNLAAGSSLELTAGKKKAVGAAKSC